MAGFFGTLAKRLFQNPLAQGLQFDNPDYVRAHREILLTNPVLKSAYDRWYREIATGFESTANVPGVLLEVGCGAGFLENMFRVFSRRTRSRILMLRACQTQ